MTPITFPPTVGGTETVVMAEHIQTVEPQHYYREHSTLVLVGGRRVILEHLSREQPQA